MNKLFVVLGLLFIAGTAFAAPAGMDLERKYAETQCWVDYAAGEDGLAGYVYFEYYEEEFPPYFEQYMNDLRDANIALGDAVDEGDVTAFMSSFSEVMNLVRKIQGAFWRESINAILNESYPVEDIADFFGDVTGDLRFCLEEGGIPMEMPT